MKGEEAVFARRSFQHRDSGHINSSVQRASGSILMMLSLPNKVHHLSKNNARVSLPIVLEKKADLLWMTDAAALMDLLEEVKWAIQVLSKKMNSACNIYDTFFCNLEELHSASASEQQEVAVDFLLRNLPYKMPWRSELDNASHNLFMPMIWTTSATLWKSWESLVARDICLVRQFRFSRVGENFRSWRSESRVRAMEKAKKLRRGWTKCLWCEECRSSIPNLMIPINRTLGA